MIYSIDVRVTAPVADTEIADRAADAVTNVFPAIELERRPGALVGTTHSLDRLSELLHRRAILDTARKEFHANLHGNTFEFSLKKQAAFEGVVTFAVGEPGELGEIDVVVTVEEPDVETFIDYVAPPTEDGTPIEDGMERSWQSR